MIRILKFTIIQVLAVVISFIIGLLIVGGNFVYAVAIAIPLVTTSGLWYVHNKFINRSAMFPIIFTLVLGFLSAWLFAKLMDMSPRLPVVVIFIILGCIYILSFDVGMAVDFFLRIIGIKKSNKEKGNPTH